MTTPSDARAADQTPLMVWEMPDRYDLIGLDITDRETGEKAFIPLVPNEVDFVGLVEHREKTYDNTNWDVTRVWRTTTRPAVIGDALTAISEYIALLEGIHNVYRHIVMDTPEDRALHNRQVENADNVLRLVKERLHIAS